MSTISWPWAIVLCKYADKPQETRPVNYYVDLFTRNGAGGLCDYFHTVSFHTIDMTGSQVFGWFTMNHNSSDLSQLHFPGDRGILVQWGIDTANANGVNLAAFRTILVVQNYGVDHGAAGNGVVIVHQDPAVCEFGFMSHEMGHGFGLPHSWSANPDFEYGDGWDVMSWQTTTFNFTISFQGAQGLATVGMNARNLEALNSVPAGRMWLQPQADFSNQFTLDPLNQTPMGNHGYLIVKFPPGSTNPARANNSAYTVEFRRKSGWDQSIPQNAVIIHEVRANGLSYLQPSAWGQFSAGQQFVTPDPKVFIYVTGIDANVGTATIRAWDIPEGSLRKEDTGLKVYMIRNGQKCWVTSPQVLFALGKTWADVRSVPDGGLSSIPNGPDINLMTISVTPYPVPVNRIVSVTVGATDMSTGAPVAGQVWIDGKLTANTNTAFSHKFATKRVRDPEDPKRFEIVYPTGEVRAQGYPNTDIDFGFP